MTLHQDERLGGYGVSRIFLTEEEGLPREQWFRLRAPGADARRSRRRIGRVCDGTASDRRIKDHSFHFPVSQKELIWVVSGTVEQEKRILGPGDSVFMPPKVVHATFNVEAEDARGVAILRPCVGDMGVEQVDLSGEAPWNGLRTRTTKNFRIP
ncbi:cupin domain-containing protein [Microvirga yunnanensis]|uniref:cupin domain-containing protein n=1 Tax=Microvirga yunnanensis TaxID=2953740 RepID=UPI0021C5F309|nr:cupin domain-containing protein [Microvirga sp. HBU65207]